ncbi:MAG: M1 family metallopeptidase [Flavobacteriales bacterium]|nr:M1 family metallopeptidase [Flavobacteriales bacterium]
MKTKYLIIYLAFYFSNCLSAQRLGYWQQEVKYRMEVNMDVKTFQYLGKQVLEYTNNSNDTLRHVYYHLYYNAFQPGSEMDIRLQTIKDPDRRMIRTFKQGTTEQKTSRIADLKSNEIGYLNIQNFKQDGITCPTKVTETILEVTLANPILPKQKAVFTLDFTGQVPNLIRRAGRNSEEGVALSMAQWYPKICAFDFEGWHADPYIGREFHGVWGDFDVKITIDKNYVVGGSGYLQNKNEIGHGYQDEGVVVKHPKKQKTLTWHFVAPKVHDFTWAADAEYAHDKIIGENGVELHFLYKKNGPNVEQWKQLPEKTNQLLRFFNDKIGPYPYKQYSVIQGGDGGMEYAMCTLITGNRSLPSLVGVTAHELAHSWFQHVLATNESKHEWMDEGFTSFISDMAMEEVMPNPNRKKESTFKSSYNNYFRMVATGREQPQTTHADRYDENLVYGISSYSKGTVFLSQLGYVIGWENMMKTLKRYYHDFQFTHPTPNDFKRTAERVSGAVLDWYLIDWTQTTNTIDYGIKSVEAKGDNTKITLERIGRMPMPLDILVEYTDGSKAQIHIPNPLMRWVKPNPNPEMVWEVQKPWHWGIPTYSFELLTNKDNIAKIVIDPSSLMADVNKDNDVYLKP